MIHFFSVLKDQFRQTLSNLYSASEIEELLVIFSEEYLQFSKTEYRMAAEFEINEDQQHKFKNALAKLQTGMPYQQVLGKASFYGENFYVNEHVLLPRPETEELLELAICKIKDWQKKNSGDAAALEDFKILDIGTGSGIIPIILKKYFPFAKVFAIDVSAGALEVAKKNAEAQKLAITFIQQDYLQRELSGIFNVVISNPPYIDKEEAFEIENSVKGFEPNIALFSPTKDALLFYRKISSECEKHLTAGGLLFLEINQKLGPETLALFKEGFSEVFLLKDLSGNDRFIFGEKK